MRRLKLKWMHLVKVSSHTIEVAISTKLIRRGIGPNVVIPPEPIFAQPTMRRPPTPPANTESGIAGAPHKEKKKIEPLHLTTSRPEFGRNRCTIKLTQGDPDAALEESGNRLRSYVVLSDLSAEAGYAIEWCIGYVLSVSAVNTVYAKAHLRTIQYGRS